jgi:peptidoglycan/LPS O-acetylase OafA/YrhL
MRKLQSLEMLRALAGLMVVLFHTQTIFLMSGHTPFHGMFSAGCRGVDLFFVLSGFIIAYVHREDLGRPNRLSNYVFNRVTRIYPAACIMTALALGVYALGFGGAAKAGKLDPAAIVASFMLVAQHGPPLVNVTWTLTYEIFFYAMFALLIINLRIGMALLVAWQVATAIIAICGIDPGFNGYYLHSICLEFSVGLVCAWWLLRAAPPRDLRASWILLALGVIGFGVGMALNHDFPQTAAFCAVGASAALILSLVRLEQAGRFQVPPFLVRMGGASYAIYIVHYSVITFLATLILRKLHLPVTDLLCLVCAGIGIGCGFAFDSLIDRPIQRALKRWRKARRGAHTAVKLEVS